MNSKTKVLNIGFMLDTSLDSLGGVQQYILTLGDFFESKGHNVFYIVGESKNSKNPNVYSLTKNLTVSFNGNKVSTPLPVKTSSIHDFTTKHKLDILHVQMPYSPFYGARVINKMPEATAVVATFHILPFGKVAKLGTKILSKILSPSLARVDKFICVSEPSQQYFTRTFNRQSIVVPNMVKLDQFRPSKNFVRNNKIPLILYSGRLTERKGCRYLIMAAGLMSRQHPDLKYKLQFSGLGEQKKELEKLAKAEGVEHLISFTGKLSETDKVLFMQKADIACFPAYSGESFGIVLLEAIAAKAGVVLAGDNPGYRSVLSASEQSLVNVRDTNEFSNKLYDFLTNKKLALKTHNLQQKIIDKYDFRTVGQNVLNVYIDCIYKRNKP